MLLSSVLVAAGCHHRKAQPVMLPPQTSVPLIELPEDGTEPLVETPKTKLPPVPVAESAGKPKKARRRSNKTATVGTATTAAKPSEAGPATTKTGSDAAVLGSLSVGGEQNPRALEEAADLIAANERRLNGLGAETAKTQAALVSKVRNFQKDAGVALKSGDAEGAKTLATKGKLLLDDLEKQ